MIHLFFFFRQPLFSGFFLSPSVKLIWLGATGPFRVFGHFRRFYAPLQQLQNPKSYTVKVEPTGRYGQRKSYGAIFVRGDFIKRQKTILTSLSKVVNIVRVPCGNLNDIDHQRHITRRNIESSGNTGNNVTNLPWPLNFLASTGYTRYLEPPDRKTFLTT